MVCLPNCTWYISALTAKLTKNLVYCLIAQVGLQNNLQETHTYIYDKFIKKNTLVSARDPVFYRWDYIYWKIFYLIFFLKVAFYCGQQIWKLLGKLLFTTIKILPFLLSTLKIFGTGGKNKTPNNGEIKLNNNKIKNV